MACHLLSLPHSLKTHLLETHLKVQIQSANYRVENRLRYFMKYKAEGRSLAIGKTGEVKGTGDFRGGNLQEDNRLQIQGKSLINLLKSTTSSSKTRSPRERS